MQMYIVVPITKRENYYELCFSHLFMPSKYSYSWIQEKSAYPYTNCSRCSILTSWQDVYIHVISLSQNLTDLSNFKSTVIRDLKNCLHSIAWVYSIYSSEDQEFNIPRNVNEHLVHHRFKTCPKLTLSFLHKSDVYVYLIFCKGNRKYSSFIHELLVLFTNIDQILPNKLHGPTHSKTGITCVFNGHVDYKLL